jgi:hypothetical protein
MKEMIRVIEQYVQGAISADEFVDGYFTLWKDSRDEQYQFRDAHPWVWRKIHILLWLRYHWLMSQEKFENICRNWVDQKGGMRVLIYSRANEVTDHLFVEADAYRPDVQGDQGWEIGEDILLREAKAALTILKEVE